VQGLLALRFFVFGDIKDGERGRRKLLRRNLLRRNPPNRLLHRD
jgi:hypothetical protein